MDFRPDIEGLRAFTLVAILLFHAEMPGADGGFVGPDIFFIISGFVITGQLWGQVSSTGTIGLRSFYGSRARRLLPVSALVGVVTVIAAVNLLPPPQARSVVGDGIASALYVCNYWFIGQNVDYFSARLPPSPFQHYWTLAVEEQFYMVWPLIIIGTAVLIRLARRWRTGTRDIPANQSKRPYIVVFALITVGSFALSLLLTYLVPAAAYFSLPTRAWDLSVGGLAALTLDQWRRIPPLAAKITGWVGFGLILLACTVFTPGMPYPGTAALVPMAGTVLILGAGCNAPMVGCGRILSWSPMRATGRLSYSWYLWHWPILVLGPVMLGYKFGLFSNLAALVFSGGLAMLTLRFVENPLRYAALLRRSPLASLAVGAAATALAAGVAIAMLPGIPAPIGHGAPAPAMKVTSAPVATGSTIGTYNAAVQDAFNQVQAAVSASVDLKAVPANLNPPLAEATADQDGMLYGGCMRMDKESGQPECAMGDTTSSTRVALVGDSHAAMWTPAFQQLAADRHWRLEMMAKAGCSLLDLPVAKHLNGIVEYFRHCEEWRGQILTRLRAEHPTLIVVSMSREHVGGSWQAGFTPYDPAWVDSLTRMVQQLRETGATVLVLGPIPDPQTAVPDCLSRHLDDASVCSPPTSTAVNEAGMAAESAATTRSGGQYADVTDLFCTKSRCPVVVGNTLVYFDWSHMTLAYSRQLAPAMGALADRALAQGK
ncbi:acyltransferase [Mycolicibacterium sphagni]|nr:acyltransferase family protein [Mycolicibacterium sphagni]MCV7175839.1 acyltransferase [Mycolicibacterium sphagni]